MATGEGEGVRDAALETLSSYVEALPAGEPPRGDRAARRRRVVPALRAHAAREHLRVRRRRVVRRASLFVTAIGGAAAAVMLATGSLSRFGSPRAGATIAVLDGTLWLDEGAERRALRAGEASGVEAKDELEAPAERLARVQLADTATMTLAPATLVGTIVAAADAPDAAPTFEAVKLVRGRAHLQVHKLHGGQRFHVLTPDADVQVRGTEFDVELRPGMTPGTCVRVEEGLVAVVAAGATHLVGADQSWGCEAPAVVATPVAVAAPEVASPVPEGHVASARERASDLRLQNTLFQTALEAERDGRYGAAAQLYRKLLARAPHGPLSAQVRSNLAVVSRPR